VILQCIISIAFNRFDDWLKRQKNLWLLVGIVSRRLFNSILIDNHIILALIKGINFLLTAVDGVGLY